MDPIQQSAGISNTSAEWTTWAHSLGGVECIAFRESLKNATSTESKKSSIHWLALYIGVPIAGIITLASILGMILTILTIPKTTKSPKCLKNNKIKPQKERLTEIKMDNQKKTTTVENITRYGDRRNSVGEQSTSISARSHQRMDTGNASRSQHYQQPIETMQLPSGQHRAGLLPPLSTDIDHVHGSKKHQQPTQPRQNAFNDTDVSHGGHKTQTVPLEQPAQTHAQINGHVITREPITVGVEQGTRHQVDMSCDINRISKSNDDEIRDIEDDSHNKDNITHYPGDEEGKDNEICDVNNRIRTVQEAEYDDDAQEQTAERHQQNNETDTDDQSSQNIQNI